MGKINKKEETNEISYNVTVDDKEKDLKVVVEPRITKKKYTSVMSAAKDLADGLITIDDIRDTDLNVNDVKAVANHLRISK